VNKPPDFDTEFLRSRQGLRPVSHFDLARHRIAPGRIKPLRPTLYVGEIERDDVWYERPLSRHWRVAYRLHVERPGTRRARLVIAEVRVLPVEPGAHPGEWSAEVLGQRARCPRGGVPGRVMNQVRSRATLDAVLRIVNANRVRHGSAFVSWLLHGREVPAPKDPAPARRGRPSARTTAFYRAFARRFAECEQNRTSGESSRRVLASEYRVPEQTIANWVRRCRDPKLGLLEPTRAGKRGANLAAGL
jgi:hypothetical protein